MLWTWYIKYSANLRKKDLVYFRIKALYGPEFSATSETCFIGLLVLKKVRKKNSISVVKRWEMEELSCT